ncbi:hypothetical protein LLU00_003781 [Escherichia coli]|nr:hypothetical protein [Escherichia coli]EID7550204.1 hypothetical protein [Escherichia coli]EIH4022314.1 hypothetical protein [Escherichia coli]EIL3280652.1 hypothetical protein [Escherichia coli]EJY6243371.1 hypothetical protein [Escherichia coli]
MDNSTISLQELLDCISKLRDDVVAFSYLAFSIPKEQMQPTLASLQLESLNPKWSQQQQNSFKWLAVLLEEKYAGEITISAESSVNQ